MKRLFVAVKFHPSEEFLDILETLKFDLADDKIKWVQEHNIHITLKFFGETPEDKIPEICDALEEATQNIRPFELSLRTTGIFGSKYEPRVIWFGIDPSSEFQKLYEKIIKNLRTIGYEPDRQNFVPHLTIGRIKYINDKKYFQKAIDRHKQKFIQTEMVDEFLLFESILKPEGPVYRVVEAFSL